MAKNNPDPRFGRLSNNTPINADGIFFTSYTLGIIYTVIARGTTVLAHYACCHGNFSEVAQQVLKNIRSEDDGMLTYASGDYMYHYICEGGVVYMCITDDEFERSKAFLFLDVIKQRFQEAYSDTIQNALPFAMNSEFSEEIAREMKRYTETSRNLLPSPATQGGIKLENIGMRDLNLAEDGRLEQLELLESDSISLRSYEAFMSPKARAKCCQCLKDYWKHIVIISVVLLVIIVLVVAIYLGVCLESGTNHCK